jgi:hypothetical protein
MNTRRNVLELYRTILKQSKLLPIEKRSRAIQQIRTTFRDNKNESDENVISSLIRTGNDKLSFIKMLTPKTASMQQGKTVYVHREGRLVEANPAKRDKAALSNWTAGNVDPDALARHNYLTRRQHFMEGPLKRY